MTSSVSERVLGCVHVSDESVMADDQQPKPWRKILYKKQGYPDVYVDPEQFLKELKSNRK